MNLTELSLQRKVRIAIVATAASWASFSVAPAAAEPLRALWPAPVSKIQETLKPPYMIVARSYFGPRFNELDVITLDPSTLKPVSRSPTKLSCLRSHVSLRGVVLCFTNAVPGQLGKFSNPTGYVFAPDLTPIGKHINETNGRPSRARISPDGRYSATTEFTSGHSYEGTAGATFSTATYIWHTDAPSTAENIQKWSVLNDRQPVTAIDLNFWGVTFDPLNSDRFYVTAHFAGKPYLAEGSVRLRRITVVKGGLECPSFSPDGKRLAFKKRTGSTSWSPAVLDLATMNETVFDVGNSVDDQIEWVDDRTLIYEVATRPLIGFPKFDLMSLDLREAKPSQKLWLEDARSPSFVRVASK